MNFFIKKLITLIITLFVISFLTFTAFSVIPGDAALTRLGKDATEEQLHALRTEMGLYDPLPQRYGRWLTGVFQGNFGESYRYEGTTVSSLLADRLPVTVLLASVAFLIILVLSIPLGIAAARYFREMAGYTDQSAGADGNGSSSVFSWNYSDLSVRTGTTFIPAGQFCTAQGRPVGIHPVPVFPRLVSGAP